MKDIDVRMPYQTFLNNIIAIKSFSAEINDTWELLGETDDEPRAYLIKKTIVDHNDNASTTNYEYSKIIACEYHITYNLSYGVPMLCLNMFNTDGKILTIGEAWIFFSASYNQDNMYSVLTQQDHPVLQKPFLVLHPCKTNEILKNFSEISKNPVVSWLSCIAPAVHLNLSNDYEKLTR